ncbi:MAG: D-alanyl-D-alanine carboxypeptidase [Afipia sp.]|nr:D-alanyl-D-alanine carboxypeptidase [Afipia sp.]
MSRSAFRPASLAAMLAALALTCTPQKAHAEATLVIEADTGKVLQAENATYPWYPASVTKIMTAYVALKAVKEGRMTLDSLLTVSPIASAQAPSKMGFKPGTTVTLDNALKMMMVKSANDIAVVIAEGVGGSVDGFADEMNRNAQRLGMTQTHYVNPNGLPAEGHVSSARDLGILARAFFKDLPEYEYFVHLPGIKFGRRTTMNFNKLIGRYPGADGMKTGFICASGFNLVASATRNGKRLIAVVLGAQSSAQRAVKAAQLLERGFSGNKLAWLRPSMGTVDQLAPIDASPPDLRDQMCGPKRKRPAAEDEDDDVEIATGTESSDGNPSMYAAGLQPQTIKTTELLAGAAALAPPVIVYTGPTRTGSAIAAADAAETEAQTPKGKGKKGKKPQIAAAKPDAKPEKKKDAKSDTKPDAKSDSKSDKKTASKPEPKPIANSAKPLSGDLKPPAKPAAKPKDASAADAPKSSSKPAADKKSDPPPKG